MDCECAQLRVAELLGAELEAAPRAELDAHLAGCPGCQAMFQEASQALGWLDEALQPPPQKVARPARARRGWRTLLRYAAVFALAFACGWALRSQQPEPQPPQHSVVRPLPRPVVARAPSPLASALVDAHRGNPRRSGLAAGLAAVLALE